MTQTVFSDAVINFGKYKGKTPAQVMGSNPSYFHWLRESGIKKLDAELTAATDEWARRNPKEAQRAADSARKKRRDVGAAAREKPSPAAAGTRTPWEETPPASADNAAWGSW